MKNKSSFSSLQVFLKLSIILGIMFLCLFIMQCALFNPKHPIPNNLSQRIKGLCDQYPPPSDFVPFDTPKSITKSDRGTYGGWYSSFTSSKDVIAHYSNMLSKDNWNVSQDSSWNISTSKKTKYITFEKDGFYIALEFTDDENIPKEEKRSYGLNCGFRP